MTCTYPSSDTCVPDTDAAPRRTHPCVMLITALVMWLTVLGARADEGVAKDAHTDEGVGLGIILGEPTGVSAKLWLTQESAVDAAAAWSFSENDSVQFHADYLFHNFRLLKTEAIPGRFPLYVGIGGRIKLEENDYGRGRNNDDTLAGVRVPFGLAYIFAQVPIDLFAEIVPILDVVPDTDFDLNGAIGARFFFR